MKVPELTADNQTGKYKRIFILIGFVFLLISCGTTRPIADIEEMSAKKLFVHHQAAMPEYKTLAGRMQLSYESEKTSQRITVSIRMEKDEVIWVKASLLGITVAKVLITPQKVSYYETINKTYFEGDFALLSDWLGTPIDFKQAQNLLLGQSIFDLDNPGYATEIFEKKYKVEPKRQPQNFIHSLYLNPENFKIALETLSQPEDERTLNIRYGDYQTVSGQYFPTDISITTSEGGTQTKIEMNLKKIDLNVDINFPFDIPEGYDRIQL